MIIAKFIAGVYTGLKKLQTKVLADTVNREIIYRFPQKIENAWKT